MIRVLGDGIVPQMRAFDDVRRALDFDSEIILGAFLAGPLGIKLQGQVIYNMEYLHDANPMFALGYLDTLKRNTVIDFSRSNVEYLRGHGVDAFYMPYGYHAGLVKSAPALPYDKRPVDVMFIGSMHHSRRIAAIEKLAKYFKVEVVTDKYGTDLDACIGRAKVHLNMHHADGQTLESVRLNYLMANGCNIVSEFGSCPELNAIYAEGLRFCDYRGIVDACREAIENPINGIETIQAFPHDCSQAAAWLKGDL